MLTDITLGQYFPGNSLLHRLDPRTKIILLFIFIVGIFIFDTPLSYVALSAGTLLLIYVSRVPFGMMLKSLKPLLWILIFTFGIHLVSTPGETIFRFWVFNITAEGFWQGFFVSLRLVLLILMSSLLTFTTSPLELTDALEMLLSPLKRIGVPAHELAMMMTIALRFVPTLLEETDRIMKAQMARGADFSSGNIIKRAQNLVPILVPLFISAFRRADELATAMEARCYRGGDNRTRMKELSLGLNDAVATLTIVMLVLVLAWLRWGWSA